MNRLSVAIIGAGMGGLATAAALQRLGIQASVYEQASRFARLGAGIQVGCNAMKVLRSFGLEQMMRDRSFYPRSWNNKEHDTGKVLFDMVFGEVAEQRYGAPYLQTHRGDLHAALVSAVPEAAIHLGHKLVGLDQGADERITLTFANGNKVVADAVVGADGVHSVVKEQIFGKVEPNFIGRVAYRGVFPTALLDGYKVDDFTKWWGPDRHIVIYYVKPDRSEIYFVTSQPDPDFAVESWSAVGDMNDLRRDFAEFHPEVRHVLAAAPSTHKWALVDRDPLASWSQGGVTLLGDACHPMLPYMGQGAAMAIEDAVVLARCLAEGGRDGVATALQRYEATRKPRTSRVQLSSRANSWTKRSTDPDWVYGYDALNEPLAELEAA